MSRELKTRGARCTSDTNFRTARPHSKPGNLTVCLAGQSAGAAQLRPGWRCEAVALERQRWICELPTLFPHSSPLLSGVSALASCPRPQMRSSPIVREERGWWSGEGEQGKRKKYHLSR